MEMGNVATGVPMVHVAQVAAPVRANWAESAVGRVSAVIAGGGETAAAAGEAPRGSARGRFKAIATVVRMHGLLTTLRAATASMPDDDDKVEGGGGGGGGVNDSDEDGEASEEEEEEEK